MLLVATIRPRSRPSNCADVDVIKFIYFAEWALANECLIIRHDDGKLMWKANFGTLQNLLLKTFASCSPLFALRFEQYPSIIEYMYHRMRAPQHHFRMTYWLKFFPLPLIDANWVDDALFQPFGSGACMVLCSLHVTDVSFLCRIRAYRACMRVKRIQINLSHH